MTIIHNISAYEDFPFTSLNTGQLAKLRLAATKKEQPLIILLECFLEIRCGDFSDNDSCNTHQLGKEFIGALYSDSFYKASHISKYRLARSFIKIGPLVWPHLSPLKKIRTSTNMTPDVLDCISLYEAAPLIADKVWLWCGWSALNRNGKRIFFPLYRTFEIFGRKFTEQISEAASNFIQRGKYESIPGLNSLLSFLSKNYNKSNEPDFLNPEFMQVFWRKFLVYHFESKYNSGDGATINYLRISWRHFLLFVNNHLNKCNCFTKARGAMPNPKVKPDAVKTKTRKGSDGIEVSCKLLTEVPLELSDNQALNLLFVDIKQDFDYILQWAKAKVSDMRLRLERRDLKEPRELNNEMEYHTLSSLQLESSNDWEAQKLLLNNLKQLGYQLNGIGLVARSASLPSAANDCALPSTNALVPHCTVLVASHSEITASFLERLQVYEKNGVYEAYTITDGAYILTGEKPRKGADKSEQHVFLVNETKQIIDDILRCTKPARDFLKSNHDDNWKYLLLTTGEGFAWPKRVSLAYATSVPSRLKLMADELQKICKITDVKAKNLATAFNMGSLRSSSGAITYIETGSTEVVAKKLGHASHQPNLLKRYLPKVLLDFFLERWIRIFQAGIIIHVMSESKFLIEATSFHSMDEVDAFLRTNILGLDKLYNYKTLEDPPKQNKGETIISLSTEIIAILIGIELHVDSNPIKAHATSRYWARFSKKIKSYITSTSNIRQDFKTMLEEAQSIATPFTLVEV
jgi:hypothetical protein